MTVRRKLPKDLHGLNREEVAAIDPTPPDAATACGDFLVNYVHRRPAAVRAVVLEIDTLDAVGWPHAERR